MKFADSPRSGFGYFLAGLLCLVLLHAVCIALFTSGFLLTRVELGAQSNNADFAAWLRDTHSASGDSEASHLDATATTGNGEQCRTHASVTNDGDDAYNKSAAQEVDSERSALWQARVFDRVVIVIIDAARFDFVHNTTAYNRGQQGSWVGRLTATRQLLRRAGHGGALFRFHADPPTTSLQRIKGLMTGGLPTFIDVGSSFGSLSIAEDNLLFQLASAGRKVEMIGDDTWLDLFPTAFHRALPFPSLVVKDIHTVDNGVLANVYPALQRDDWSVLIAHYLGVDHVGHTFSVDSPAMDSKLDQMNQMMLDMYDAMLSSGGLHRRSLLLFMSDHGQTLSGDHGGGTPEEAHAFLLALSLSPPPAPPPSLLSPCQGYEEDEAGNPCVEDFQQIDFAPSLAAALGVPIPYASVGAVNARLLSLCAASWHIPPPLLSSPSASHQQGNCGTQQQQQQQREEEEEEFLANNGVGSSGSGSDSTGSSCRSEGVSETSFLQRYEAAVSFNAWQVHRYLTHYSSQSAAPFPRAAFSHLLHTYHQATNHTPSPSSCPSTSLLSSSITSHLSFLLSAASLARAQWTQFDLPHMLAALLLFSLTLAMHLALALRCLPLAFAAPAAATADAPAAIADAATAPATADAAPAAALCHLCSSGSPSAAAICSHAADSLPSPPSEPQSAAAQQAVHRHPVLPSPSQQPRSGIGSGSGIPLAVLWPLTALLIHALSLTSNSFIMAEGHVVAFLLATSVILRLRTALLPCSFSLPAARRAVALLLVHSLFIACGLSGMLKATTSSTTSASASASAGASSGHSTDTLSSAVSPPPSSPAGQPSGQPDAHTPLHTLLPFLQPLASWLLTLPLTLPSALSPVTSNPAAFLSSLTLALSPLRSALSIYLPLVALPLVFLRLTVPLPPPSARASPPSRSEEGDETNSTKTIQVAAAVNGVKGGPAASTAAADATATTSSCTPPSSSAPSTQNGFNALSPHLLPCPSSPSSPLTSSAVLLLRAGVCVLFALITVTWALEGWFVPPTATSTQQSKSRGMLPITNLREVVHLCMPRVIFLCTLTCLGLALLLLCLEWLLPRPAHTPSTSSTSSTSSSMHIPVLLIAVLSAPIVLVGGHGAPLLLLLVLVEACLLLSLHCYDCTPASDCTSPLPLPLPAVIFSAAVEWNLFASLVFFGLGHRCSFDGLRYAAAFTGFDDFQYHRQAALLALDTYGPSHLLPVFALPLIASLISPPSLSHRQRAAIRHALFLFFLLPSCLCAFVTMGFVALQRRHLMVWSLFAPKYVFDSIGLIVTDVLLLAVAAATATMH